VTALAGTRETFLAEVRRISREVASVAAEEVDRDARFPAEAIDALREIGALSALVPVAHGGAGLSLADAGAACQELARGCSATAMVYAMHQLQVGQIVRHTGPEGWHADYLSRLSDEQRLISSVTSEVGTGGDMGRSIAALEPAGPGRLHFVKQAPTVSYGAHGDDLMTTLRRAPDADESDQVMVVHARASTELVPAGGWDTLGMRGTCSPAFTVSAEIGTEQVVPVPLARMLPETVVPYAHILWANVWLGIATEALDRGRAFVRAAARRTPGQPVPAARRISEVLLEVQMLRGELAGTQADFERWDQSEDRTGLRSMPAVLRFNGLKLGVSERVPGICMDVLGAVGMTAYRNDSPFSVGRLLRDSLSGQLMIGNERLHAANAQLLAITKEV
jgi:acyl-CoA dehydrogenase